MISAAYVIGFTIEGRSTCLCMGVNGVNLTRNSNHIGSIVENEFVPSKEAKLSEQELAICLAAVKAFSSLHVELNNETS